MLTFAFKKSLRDFDLNIEQVIGKETLVLIGHSGCGKSTTLKILAGLVHPDDGKIELNNKILSDNGGKITIPPEERNIGLVFQNYALFPHLTVTENIAYGISRLPEDEKEKRIKETLSFLGIGSLAGSKPGLLSGGEQQRVALARALVTKPKLLLLDEPLSALDVSTRSYVRTELKEILKNLSIPTIVVTHDYEDARILADRVAVMDRGKIIQSGTPSEIAQFPANHFVAEFTGTNLMQVEKGMTVEKEIDFVAFDPWRVKITRQSSSSLYEWCGKIRDIAWVGGSTRLHISDNEASFYADIPIGMYEEGNYQVGETVFAMVEARDVRVIPVTSELLEYKKRVKAKQDVKLPKEKMEKRKKYKRKWIYSLIASLFFLFVITAYGYNAKTATTKQVQMFSLVAANATDPFNDLIEVFEGVHQDVMMDATYAGTQIIRTQLEQGAKGDLFLSADLEHIQAVKEQGLIEEFFPVSHNSVVIVVPKDDRIGIKSLQDVATKSVKLVIGTDTVPIGKYTREIFDKAKIEYGNNFLEMAMQNVVSYETNVKQVLQKVSMGEAEAGLVYITDVTSDFQERVNIIMIPKKFNVVATNYISVVTKAPNKKLAEKFMEMALSTEGQAIFEKFGYETIK